MSIGSSAGASKQCPPKNATGEFPFEVGIATIPQVDPAHPKVISQGPSVCMFDKGAGKEQEMIATWLFMKFLTSTELFQAAFSMASGYVPVLNSCMTNDIYANHLKKANGNSTTGVTALAAKVCMEQSEAYFVSPAFYGSSVARDEVGLLIQSCFVNSPKSGQTLREFIQEEFDKTIARCNSKIS
jgi:multiple sugar transport system substrate-binding protein